MTDEKIRKIRIVSLATKKKSKSGSEREGDNCPECRVQCPFHQTCDCKPQCTCKPICNCNPEYECTCYPKPVPPPKAQGGKGQKKQKLPKGSKESHQTFFKIAGKIK